MKDDLLDTLDDMADAVRIAVARRLWRTGSSLVRLASKMEANRVQRDSRRGRGMAYG